MFVYLHLASEQTICTLWTDISFSAHFQTQLFVYWEIAAHQACFLFKLNNVWTLETEVTKKKSLFVLKDLQMKIIFVSDIGSLETFVVYVFLNYSLLYNDSDYLDKVIEIFDYAVSIWDFKAK